jgi:hypothetical protein
MAQIIQAIKVYAKSNSVDPLFTAEAMDPWFVECKKSVAKIIIKCQDEGLIPKKAHGG